MAAQDPTHMHCLEMIEKGVPGHAQGKYEKELASYFCYNSIIATFYITGSTLAQIAPVRSALIDGWVDGLTRATPATFRRKHFRERRNIWKDKNPEKYKKFNDFYLAHRDEMIGD